MNDQGINLTQVLRLGYESFSIDPQSGALDCLGVWRTVMLSLDLLPHSLRDITDGHEFAEALTRWSEKNQRSITKLPNVRACTKLGDTVLGGDFEKPSMFVLVECPPQQFLTSIEGKGVHLVRSWNMPSVHGCYRIGR